jgi:hypothetical protein
MPRLRLVAGSAVLALAVAGCGSGGASSVASKNSSGGASTRSSSPSTQVEATVQDLRDRVQKTGTGTFSTVTTTIAGKVVSSVRGRYALGDQQLAARLQVPQGSGSPATARIDVVKGAAYFQVAQWKQPSRSCWLRTTTEQLSQEYGLDVATADQVPLAVNLLDNFRALRSNGVGLVDGNLDITAVLPLLSGATKVQLVAAKPKGVVPAFLTFDGDNVLVTVPGYALSTALSQSLKVDESKFASIAADRYEAGLKVTGPVAAVRAPSSGRQMSAADLQANRCG